MALQSDQLGDTDIRDTNEFHRLHDNEAAYHRYKIKPRILVNVDNIDLSSSIFGIKVGDPAICIFCITLTLEKTSLPLGFSPAAMHCLAHPDGELATSRAAAKYGLAMALSSYSTISLEDVRAQGQGNPYAMQLCVLRNRDITRQLLRRAEGKWA